MPNDRNDVITRVAANSDIVRVYPNAAWVLYAAGTTSPVVDSGSADEYGNVSIANLETGHYDLYVDGTLRGSFHHVKADYAQKHPRTWTAFIAGTITTDLNENENSEVFFAPVTGKIVSVEVLVHYSGPSGDATIHILKGTTERATPLNFTFNSIWSVRCNPGESTYDWGHVDSDPGLDIESQRAVAIGLDYTTGTIRGVAVTMIYKPD